MRGAPATAFDAGDSDERQRNDGSLLLSDAHVALRRWGRVGVARAITRVSLADGTFVYASSLPGTRFIAAAAPLLAQRGVFVRALLERQVTLVVSLTERCLQKVAPTLRV